ncbi:MAG: glycosyltransferase family 2 protein [Bacteroidales bacterium]|nr:glycosyltransferase family 2 protein [Bacteroidales bacterium]MCF8327603.1 glycosyltransferase family 2 protein [Bacteroidales bacterium]
MEKLSIVVIVYNEKGNIRPLTEKIRKDLSSYNYELIFVDDGSTDGTLEEIKEIQGKDLKLVELMKNFGQSSAMAAGIDVATGEYIITMDGDLQNDSADIPQMLDKLKEENLDLVSGIRKNRQDGIFFRKLPSRIANMIIRRSTNVKIEDYGCTLKIFKSKIAKNLGLYGELHRFIPVLASLEGARIGQMEVRHHARKFGKSKYGMGRTLKVISDLILMVFFKRHMQKPMHLFGGIGIVLFFIGVILNIYLLLLKIAGQDIWGKPLLLLGVILLLAGIQLITVGVIAELLLRVYYESQQKKPYTIRKVFVNGEEMEK